MAQEGFDSGAESGISASGMTIGEDKLRARGLAGPRGARTWLLEGSKLLCPGNQTSISDFWYLSSDTYKWRVYYEIAGSWGNKKTRTLENRHIRFAQCKRVRHPTGS